VFRSAGDPGLELWAARPRGAGAATAAGGVCRRLGGDGGGGGLRGGGGRGGGSAGAARRAAGALARVCARGGWGPALRPAGDGAAVWRAAAGTRRRGGRAAGPAPGLVRDAGRAGRARP